MNGRILPAQNGAILTLTLNQPERLNPVDFDILVQLAEMLDSAANNPEIRVVILTGAGKAFCAGGDMQVMDGREAGPRKTREELTQLARRASNATALLHSMPKPTIASIRGAAAGGGLGLACACDIRIASETAKFTFAYPKIGLGGDVGSSYFVNRLLGPAKALEFCLRSPLVRAPEALALGLVNHVVPDAELEARTGEIAEELAAAAPLGLAAVKQNLRAAEAGPMEAAFDVEAQNVIAGFRTADHKEAARAFLEKRKPSFSGK
jgi:2-(1,2-epoxy-1,2-dihydrophenyl)acetyl-CoA isomerase